MLEILSLLKTCQCLLPKRYFLGQDSYIVGKDFIIPFSHEIDYLFEDFEFICSSIETEINSFRSGNESNIENIHSFNSTMFKDFFKKNFEVNFEYFFGNEFVIESLYYELTEKIEKLILMFFELQKKNK